MNLTRTEYPSNPSVALPLEAGLVFGQYELIREIGRGGMGQVFLARDSKLGRRVAIKFLSHPDDRLARRFEAEARTTANCEHENIVVIHDVGKTRGYTYMVLEYLEGETLRTWIEKQWQGDTLEVADPSLATNTRITGVSPAQAIELMVPVVRALAYAHEIGLVHRDLKPENIMLTDRGLIKVLDFGIAKVLTKSGKSHRQSDDDFGTAQTRPGLGPGVVTNQGGLLGTGPYMSPEQWGADEVDERSDIWAVGIMLWELVTGEHPLTPISAQTLKSVAKLDQPMPSLVDYRPDLGALAELIDRCLVKSKGERLESTAGLLAALESLPFVRTPAHRASTSPMDENPFTGLSAFQEADAARFFGREQDIASMISRLNNQRMIMVAGPSGAGKSSFIRAGLIPALKRSGTRWRTMIVRPGRSPLVALTDALVATSHTTEHGFAGFPDTGTLRGVLRSQPGALGAALRQRSRSLGTRILLFVDQFEELYTLGVDRMTRKRFVQCLEGVADDASSPLRVVLSMRSDFLDHVAEDREFTHELTQNITFLPPMGRPGLRDALLRPLEESGCAFESSRTEEELLDALEATASPLPLLQFVAAALWEARDRERNLLTEDSYRDVGGVAGALSRHADVVIASLGANERKLARAIFSKLVTPERTRAIVSVQELQELAPEEPIESVLRQLADARLVLIDSSSERETTVEIIHESLIDGWATLKRWLHENLDDDEFLARLASAARQWESGDCDDGFLWRGQAAAEAREWHEKRGAHARMRHAIGDRESRYLAAVVGHDDATRRHAERRRKWRGALVSLAFIILVAGLLLVLQLNRRANVERDRAEVFAATSKERLLDLYIEQGRQALLAGDARRAIAYFTGARRDGARSHALDFMITRATRELAGEIMVLPHRGWAMAVQYSPDGSLLATGGDEAVVRVWDTTSGALRWKLSDHTWPIWTVTFNPNGSRLVSASWDGTARVWNMATGETVWTAHHDDRLYWAEFSPDGTRLGTSSTDDHAKIWDATTGRLLQDWEHASAVSMARFSHDGRYLVTAATDGSIHVFDVQSGETVSERQLSASRIRRLEISPDDERIFTVDDARALRITPLRDGEIITVETHDDVVNHMTLDPERARVLTASEDQTARVWDMNTGEKLLELKGHTGGIADVDISPDGIHIATSGRDATVKLWDATTGDLVWTFLGHRDAIWKSAFDPTGARLATAGFDNTVRVWNARQSPFELVLQDTDDECRYAAHSPDGRFIATVRSNAAEDHVVLQLWDGQGRRLETFESALITDKLDTLRLDWRFDGRRVLVSGGSRAIAWDVHLGKEIARYGDHGKHTRHAIHSPDGQHVLTAGDDHTIKIWDARSGALVDTLEGHEGNVKSLDIDARSGLLLSASADKTARIWDLDSRALVKTWSGKTPQPLNTARFSPDGTFVITAAEDMSATIWSVSGDVSLDLEGHSDAILDANFSPDGRLAATASDDGTVKVWDTTTGVLLWSSTMRLEHVWSVHFSPDGASLMAAQGPSAKMWAVHYDERDIRELERFAVCRTAFRLENGRIERTDSDGLGCAEFSRRP